jgi:hypothetical protein
LSADRKILVKHTTLRSPPHSSFTQLYDFSIQNMLWKVASRRVFHPLTFYWVFVGMVRGMLHSVDFPVHQSKPHRSKGEPSWSIPQKKESGWVVPSQLRRFRDPRIGRSEDMLPSLVDELNGGIEVFLPR